MAYEALKRFMVERLIDLDPTLSDEQGSEIYSKVINPLVSRLGTDPKTVDIETFLVSRLSDELPGLDVSSPGSVLRDLLISPLVLLLEPIRREINFLKTQLSVADFEILATDELDALLSNLFSSRNIGEHSRGSVRVFFSAPQAVAIDGSIVFSTSDGIAFVSETIKTFRASEMTRSGNLFYIDIPVRSNEATVVANVPKGTVRFANGLEGVVRVTNRTSFSGGVSEETGEEFIERAERSLSERSLNTRRGIETNILNNFSGITSLEVIGYGESLMQRDILKGRATLSADEVLGPLLYTASSFRSESVFSHPDSANALDFLIPFTNTIRLIDANISPEAGLIKSAKYIRIIGAGEDFSAFLLNRVRTVGTVTVAGDDLLVQTTDFTVYPSPSSPTIPKKSFSQDIFTNGDEWGFNKFATQGSAYSLIGSGVIDPDPNAVEVILGAPLPFTDYVDADSILDKPAAAIPGQDFLVVVRADDTYELDYQGEATNALNEYHVPAQLKLFPISRLYPDHKIGVERIDACMTSKDRINYQGAENFVYSPDIGLSGKAEGVQVIDFGGPALTQDFPANYDGSTLEDWSKNAGVSLEGRDPGYQADLFDSAQTLDIGTIAGEVKECDVVLNPQVVSWAARGVKVGHFISLSVFDDTFVGELSGVNTDIRWNGWGRIKKIDPNGDGDFHRMRVEGLDWATLHSSGAGTFSSYFPGVFGSSNINSYANVATTPLTTNAPVNTEFTFKLTPVPLLLASLFASVDAPNSPWEFRYNTATSEIDAYNSLAQLEQQNVGTINPLTGYITLTSTVEVTGSWTASYFPLESKYRAFWTVFEGERQMVAPDGKLVLSYDELTFLPAYKGEGNLSILQQGSVAAVSSLSYVGDHEDPQTNQTLSIVDGFRDLGDAAYNQAYGYTGLLGGSHTGAKAWWIRLDKSFFSKHNSLAASPSELCVSAELYLPSDFAGTVNPQPVNGAPPAAIQVDYPAARFSQSTALTNLTGHFRTVVSSPFTAGGRAITNPTDETTMAVAQPAGAVNNQMGHSGFLIPFPFGPTQVAPYDDAAFSFTNMMVCVHDSLESIGETITGITVSDMPGSVPFPDFFDGNLVINDDEVHIGGLTDIYVKPTSSETETSGVINFSSESLTDTEEVLVEASDGGLITNSLDDEQKTHFTSIDLSSYIHSNYGLLPKYLDDLVIQLIEPPVGLTPTFFRVLHVATGGVKIDGEFSGPDSATNLRFRLLKRSTTSLSRPLNILQQGSDLKVLGNSLSVDLLGGVEFNHDVSLRATFLHIDSGDNFGEYLVTSKSATTLGLADPVPFSGENVSYRVYTRQGSGVSLPLVRVKSVGLAGDQEGFNVPYKDPIDIISSSFTGLNDDPITDSNTGQTGILSEAAGGTFFTVPGEDLVAAGVATNSVLRIDNLDNPLKYFYVTDIVFDVLVLDRQITLQADLLDLTFTIGHPSIGTADLVFKDKTFIEVGPDTKFSFTDTIGQVFNFRPSPAETAVLFQSDVDSTEAVLATTALDGDTISSTTDNWLKYGIEAGDTVQILTKVIKTGEFTEEEAEALNLSGSILSVKVDGSVFNVVFSGNNPLKLSDISSAINRQLSGKLTTAVEDGVVPDTKVLAVYSRNAVIFENFGSIGILNTLKFTPGGETSNIEYPDLITIRTVELLRYDEALRTSSIVLNDKTQALAVGDGIFIKVTRAKHQRLYPTDLTTDSDGFFRGTVKLTSYDPFTTETVEANQQLSISGHTSLGYECVVENNNYSYSLGEKVSVRVTSVMLPDFADSFKEVFALPGSGATITYDRSPDIESIQSYVLQPFVRVVCNNPLVRHYFPAYPVFNLDYAGFSPVSEVRGAIETFLTTLYPNRPLEVYDLTTVLSKRRVSFVSYPLEVAVLTHDKDRKLRVVRSTNVIVLDNNFHLMEDLSMVTVNRVG